ncbi:MAG: efflux RND transporter periplasmic adaptor subunit [Chloroflexi bacterium]|nr:efflux RND transporter periplasmic adaptor subunit [Chloroflexota bacterium]
MAVTTEPVDPPAAPPHVPAPDGSAQPFRIASLPVRRRRRANGLVRIVLLLTMALVAAGLAWLGIQSWSVFQPLARADASGVIEAEEVLISSEVAARLVDLRVEEGQTVQAGTVLARLDDAAMQLQLQLVDATAKRALDVEMAKYTLRAPITGQVTRTPMRQGELTLPGQPVVALTDLSRVKATIYVPLRDLGQVAVGQAVAISADHLPGLSFWGMVTSINGRAEYTPRNTQTARDRLNLVFGVKVRIDNPDGLLRPGVPVDARFVPGSSTR